MNCHLIKDMEQEPERQNVLDEEATAFAHCFYSHEDKFKHNSLFWEGQYREAANAIVRRTLCRMAERKNNLEEYLQKTLVKIFRIHLRVGFVRVLRKLKYLQLAMLWAAVELYNRMLEVSMHYM